MAYGCRIAKESRAIAESNDAERIMALNGVFDKKQKGRIRHRGFAEAIQGDFEFGNPFSGLPPPPPPFIPRAIPPTLEGMTGAVAPFSIKAADDARSYFSDGL